MKFSLENISWFRCTQEKLLIFQVHWFNPDVVGIVHFSKLKHVRSHNFIYATRENLMCTKKNTSTRFQWLLKSIANSILLNLTHCLFIFIIWCAIKVKQNGLTYTKLMGLKEVTPIQCAPSMGRVAKMIDWKHHPCIQHTCHSFFATNLFIHGSAHITLSRWVNVINVINKNVEFPHATHHNTLIHIQL